MSVIDRIDMLVSEARLRGFKTKKKLGLEIENMDAEVEDRDVLFFQKILNKYLSKVDPRSDMNIVDAIVKLSDSEALALYDELSDLHYHK